MRFLSMRSRREAVGRPRTCGCGLPSEARGRPRGASRFEAPRGHSPRGMDHRSEAWRQGGSSTRSDRSGRLGVADRLPTDQTGRSCEREPRPIVRARRERSPRRPRSPEKARRGLKRASTRLWVKPRRDDSVRRPSLEVGARATPRRPSEPTPPPGPPARSLGGLGRGTASEGPTLGRKGHQARSESSGNRTRPPPAWVR